MKGRYGTGQLSLDRLVPTMAPLVDEERRGATILWSQTHISKRKHAHGTNGVGQHAQTKDVHMVATLNEIPKEVSKRKALAQPTESSIFPNAALPLVSWTHRYPLLIVKDDIQAQGTDEHRLEEGHHMDIPIDLGPVVQQLIFLRHEASAENGRYDTANYSVEREGEEHLVSMQGQGRQAERIGIW